MSLSRECVVAAKARADAALHFDGHPDDWDDVAHSAVVDVPVMADALLRVLDLHHEGVAYADDMDEADDVPEDYERHFCHEDGETWPCATVRAVTGDTERSTT